jgi:5-methylcytosine-specific restriction endonuclease McrA
MARPNEFSPATQQLALNRQKNRCASCGARIVALGNAARCVHRFGEGAQAHHIRHVKQGGLASIDNCVILCQSCHYSAHEGGNFRFGLASGRPKDYPYLQGGSIPLRPSGR